jgi:glycosyltransferase involved in cell wall biosynthesis
MLSKIMVVKSLKIGVIYGGISDQKAGMDHYLHQILLAMKRIAPEHRYVLIDHRRQQSTFRDHFEQLIVDLPAHPMGLTRWNLLAVPKILDQFDLIYSPGLYGPVRIPQKVASVMMVPDLTRYLFPGFFSFNPVQKILDWFAYPAMLRRYNHILTISRTTQKDLMTLFNIPQEKITVIYPWAEESFQPLVDIETLVPFIKRYGLKRPFILFLSTLEPRKNIVTLIRAFAGLKDQIPHDLVLVGQRGWKYAPIFKEIGRQKLQERVHWIGYVPDEERVLFYNAADLLVFPSWYEGFGLPLLEAMQSGCPVISSQVSSMPEVVGDSGLLIDPNRVEDLQKAMLRLVQEPGLTEKLRRAGLEQAQKFSWETSARITLEVFEKTVSGKRLKTEE